MASRARRTTPASDTGHWQQATQAGRQAVSHAGQAIGSEAGLLRDQALVLADRLCTQGARHARQSATYLRGHPWHGFALAVAAGAALTAWFTRRP